MWKRKTHKDTTDFFYRGLEDSTIFPTRWALSQEYHSNLKPRKESVTPWPNNEPRMQPKDHNY